MGNSGDAERNGPSPAAEPGAQEESLEDLECWAIANGIDLSAATAAPTPTPSTVERWMAEAAALDNSGPTDARSTDRSPRRDGSRSASLRRAAEALQASVLRSRASVASLCASLAREPSTAEEHHDPTPMVSQEQGRDPSPPRWGARGNERPARAAIHGARVHGSRLVQFGDLRLPLRQGARSRGWGGGRGAQVNAVCDGPAFQILEGLLLRARLSGRRGAVAFSVATVSHHHVLRWRLGLGLVLCARRRRTGLRPRRMGPIARAAAFVR